MRVVAALDQGTTSTRVLAFPFGPDVASNEPVASCQIPLPSNYPHPGWCEQDPMAIVETAKECLRSIQKQLADKNIRIEAVGITNQRETLVCWDKITGKPTHPAVVWLDTRNEKLVADLIDKAGSKHAFQKITGLPLSTYFTATKLAYLLQNDLETKKAFDEDRLCCGTVDTWLIWNLTNRKAFVTDVTNASRTMLTSLSKPNVWDDGMCAFFGIKKECLPQIKSSSEIYGYFSSDDGKLVNVPIAGCLGDQQAALVGQQCFNTGDAKNTYGTGCFLLCNTGTSPVYSSSGLLTTVGYQLGPSSPVHYALEGSIAIAGAGVTFLSENFNMLSQPSDISKLAESVPDSAGVFFVPALNGLFAPYWCPDARGLIIGLTQHSTKHHLARALLDAIAFQTREILDAIEKDITVNGNKNEMGMRKEMYLSVDGGLSASDILMQIQADVLKRSVQRPSMRETTAYGAAIAAALALGFYQMIERESNGDVFHGRLENTEREARYKVWKKAVEKSMDWAATIRDIHVSE